MLWTRLLRSTARRRVAGPGANVVVATAQNVDERAATVVAQLGALHAGEYVIFADHDNIDDYVQFACNSDGSLLMEVASGAYSTGHGHSLSDQHLAQITLSGLGLHVTAGENFSAGHVTASHAEIADWIETIFVNLFRAQEDFTMDVLTDPARRSAAAANG